MSLYLNGTKILGSLVTDGDVSNIVEIFEGTASTNKWAEPLVYNSVNILNYEIICFKGTDQNVPFNLYYKISDLPISATPGSGGDYLKFSTNGYLYVSTSGYLYFYVETNRTLVLSEIIVC